MKRTKTASLLNSFKKVQVKVVFLISSSLEKLTLFIE